MRLMMASMIPWASIAKPMAPPFPPRTGAAPAGRLAGLIVACDALVQWCAADRRRLSRRNGMHRRQDLRQRISEGSGHRTVDEDPRRPLVPARPHFGDNVHEYLAPCIYEGEGEMLAMASSSRWSSSTARSSSSRSARPCGRGDQEAEHGQPGPPWALRRRCSLRPVAGRPVPRPSRDRSCPHA